MVMSWLVIVLKLCVSSKMIKIVEIRFLYV
jgi:hypothetical protein